VSSPTRKQGDHVFNNVATAVLSPFQRIASFRLSHGDGRDFVHRYMLHSYHLAKDLADRQFLRTGRRLSASEGAQEDVLREFSKLRSRSPALAKITPDVLHEVHTNNSRAFGEDVRRYEITLLSEIQHALETVLSPQTAGAHPRRSGFAFQQMLDAAYDPAAALVVITSSMACETVHLQPAFVPVIVEVAESLEQPGMWKLPYRNFREEKKTATGAIVTEIGNVQLGLDSLKSTGVLFTKMLQDEIAQGPKIMPRQTEAQYGEMLHLVHQELQKMGGA
jgi:hypothetical protein